MDENKVEDPLKKPLAKLLNSYSNSNNKKTRLLIIFSGISLILFLTLASVLPFKDQLLNSLYPKKQSQAQTVPPSTYQVPVLSLKYLPVKPCGMPLQKIDLSSATATSNRQPYNAQGAIDGSMNTKWMPNDPFNGIEVLLDLSSIITLRSTVLYFYSTDMPESFHIDASATGAFTGEQVRIVTETNSLANYFGGGKIYTFNAVDARYIKMTFDSYRSNNPGGPGFQTNLYEWEFYSDPPAKQCVDTAITGTSGVVSDPNDPDPLAYMRNRLAAENQTIINVIKEGSRYLGYKNPNAQSSINPVIYEDREFLEPVPVSPVFSGKPDYRGILNNLNICNYVDNLGVKEVWMWGYHTNQIGPEESDMVMGRSSQSVWNMPQGLPNSKWYVLPNASWGDISNSTQTDDLPVCNKTYTLYNFSYNVGVGNALHNYIHQMENVFGYADREMFWDMYTGKQYGFAGPRRCGNSHAPPNLDAQYNYGMKTYVRSDCENWLPASCINVSDINADCGGLRANVNCDNWGCTEIGFYTWWMQNIPGFNNTLSYNGQKLKNWWDFMGDFDAAMVRGKALVEPGLPTPTPVPTATPITVTVNLYSKPGDGYVRSAGSPIWDTIHNAVDGAAAYTSSANTFIRASSSLSPAFSDGFIYRAFIPIDTSSIPDNATIISAALNLNFYNITNNDNDGNDFISLMQTSQASPSTIRAADYDQAGAVMSPVEGSNRLDISSIAPNQYTGIALNNTGLSWINTTGVTLLGFREGHDIANIAVDNNTENDIRAYSSEQTGTSQDPYLTITYTIPASPTPTPTPTPISTTVTVNIYSGAGDGYIDNADTGGSWSVAHDAAAGNLADYTANHLRVMAGYPLGGNPTNIRRGFIPFDTSAIPDDAIITAAALNFYVYSINNGDNDGNDFLGLVQTSQAKFSSLVADDYDQAGAISNPVEGATRIDYGKLTLNVYNTIILNQTGLNWIDKTGVTKLGLREGHDILNDPYAGASNTYNQIRLYSSEQTGTSKDPYLTISYYIPPMGISLPR